MEDKFKLAYDRLNKAQKQAVDYIDGPLLVIAGPGTGKTELLSVRVANILRQTDSNASNILCLTFTNSATQNMKERLFKLIGKDANYLNIQTFHSFGAEIMQLFPQYFWNGARLTIVPDAVQLDIIQDILSQLPLDNPLSLKFGNYYSAVRDVKDALKNVKEAGLTPKSLRSIINENIKYINQIEDELANAVPTRLSYKTLENTYEDVLKLADQKLTSRNELFTPLSEIIKSSLKLAILKDDGTNKTKNTALWKSKWLQNDNGTKKMLKERNKNEWWLNLADVYELYRNTLHSRGYYDYSDMIIEVITQLQNHQDLVSEVQEKYNYILIDEFQDTTKAQFNLAFLVANNNAQESQPNFMAVGDDDQSIYAFNGAELSNMITFRNSLPNVKTLILSENYRSNEQVLEASSSIINTAETRLVNLDSNLRKDLIAVSNYTKGDIKHIIYPTKEHQLSFVAKRIATDFKNNPDKNIAVLARSHSSLINLSAQLLKEKVSIKYEKQNNTLDNPLIRQVLYIIEIIDGFIKGDLEIINSRLSLVLSHPAWNIKPTDLWEFALSQRINRSNWLIELENSKNSQLKELGNWLNYLIVLSSTESMNIMIEYILGLRAGENLTSPYKSYYLDNKQISSSYLDGISAINVILDLIKEFALSKNKQPTLNDFITFINLNINFNNTITDQSWFSSGDRAVELMSIHKSKGLEFDIVYLIDAIENEWKPRKNRKLSPANLALSNYEEGLDEYARLAYVAATRSKQSFIVSSYRLNEKSEKILPSSIFLDISEEIFNEDLEEEDKISLLENNLAWPELDTKEQNAIIRPIIENFQLTATNFNQYLDIVNNGPSTFLQSAVLRLPSQTTDSMAFGTAMHTAMQNAQELTNLNKFELSKVIEAFNNKLSFSSISNQQLIRLKEKGEKLLNKLFLELEYKLPEEAKSEYKISKAKIGDAFIGGSIDHIEEQKDKIIITDYKTGKPLTNFYSKAQDNALKSWRYKNQLMFYAVMLKTQSRYKKIKNIETQLVYLEADNLDQLVLKFIPTKEQLERTEKLINAVWQQVMKLNFKDPDFNNQGLRSIENFEIFLLNNFN